MALIYDAKTTRKDKKRNSGLEIPAQSLVCERGLEFERVRAEGSCTAGTIVGIIA